MLAESISLRVNLRYPEQLCGWASDAGFYIIIDLHGAPGTQVAHNVDTGRVCTLDIQANKPTSDPVLTDMRLECFFCWLLFRLPVREGASISGVDGRPHPLKIQLSQRRYVRNHHEPIRNGHHSAVHETATTQTHSL